MFECKFNHFILKIILLYHICYNNKNDNVKCTKLDTTEWGK